MGHLRNSKQVQAVAKAGTFVMKQGLGAGLKVVGMATGPIGWVLSFLGKKIIENKIEPHAKALGVNAARHWEARQNKKRWKSLYKQGVKTGLTSEEFIALRKKMYEYKKK